MKEVLIGTTNPSKVKRFELFLTGYDIRFYTLHDLHITDEPEEQGHTPEERCEGWPLDSLSVNRNTMTYFVDNGNDLYDTQKEEIILGEYREPLVHFLVTALGIE